MNVNTKQTFEERHGMTRDELRQQVSEATAQRLIENGKNERKDLLLLGRQFGEQGRRPC